MSKKQAMSQTEIDYIADGIAEHVRQKLKENAHKGSPKGLSSAYCFKRLIDESSELFVALFGPASNQIDAMKEAADVACFAFFAAMNTHVDAIVMRETTDE